jgi:hypothetical protein
LSKYGRLTAYKRRQRMAVMQPVFDFYLSADLPIDCLLRANEKISLAFVFSYSSGV